MKTTLERIELLEQSNKRLKGVVIVLSLACFSFIALGAAAPPPKTVTAERFVLVDEAGNVRAELSTSKTAAALQFLNANHTPALIVAAGDSGSGVFIADGAGETRTSLLVSSERTDFAMLRPGLPKEVLLLTDNKQGTAMSIRDANGKEKLSFGNTYKGASLGVFDNNETARAVVAEQGLITFSKGGQLEWASFGEKLSPEERKQVMDLMNGAK